MRKRKSWEHTAEDILRELGPQEEAPRFLDVWAEYLSDPYLRHLTFDELAARLAYLQETQHVAWHGGFLRGDLLDLGTYETADLIVATYAEACSRLSVDGVKEWATRALSRVARPDPGILEPATRLLRGIDEPPGEYLVRYGRLRHMRALVADGSVRLRRASYYATDQSLNRARADHEGRIELALPPGASVPGLATVRSWGELVMERRSPTGRRDVIVESGLEPYVYCLSNAMPPRLFEDFEADACVLIHDVEDFLNALGRTVAVQLGRGMFSAAGPVTYYDPARTGVDVRLTPFLKHHRFRYQREYRVFFVPPRDESPMVLDLRMGSQEHCASVHHL